jgi:hypothetical protein
MVKFGIFFESLNIVYMSLAFKKLKYIKQKLWF